MNRRAFVAGIGAFVVAPGWGQAQPAAATPLVASLVPGPPGCRSPGPHWLHAESAFIEGLRTEGFVVGQNVTLAPHCFQVDAQARELIPEVVRRQPSVIMATGTPAALAAKAATSTIPVVFAAVGDPVAVGLVPTLSRPSGNVTGVSNMRAGLVQKHVELLTEVVSGVARVAVLIDPTPELGTLFWREAQDSARGLGVGAIRIDAATPADIEEAFLTQRKDAQGLVVTPSGTLWVQRLRISALAAKHRWPSIFPWVDAVEAGGLVAYATNDSETFRVAGKLVGRVLKGAKPTDLPVEQPTKFELVINLKAATALGLAVPQSLLLRADRVIQ